MRLLNSSATDLIGGVSNGTVDLLSTRQTDGSANLGVLLSPGSSGAPTQRLTVVGTTGNVGIATTSPWRTLSVAGTVGFDGLTGSTGAGSVCLDSNKQLVYNSGSDACLSSTRATKHDIQNLDFDALALVSELQPVSFVYNNDASSTVRYGFIAEDTAAVDPHLATYDTQGAISGIDDRSVIAVIVDAIRDFADRFTTKELTFVRATGDEITVRKANIQQANVQELCVGSTCLTESQVQALLNQAGQKSSPPPETPQASEETEEPDSSVPEASDAPPIVSTDTPEEIPATEPADAPAAE